MDRKSHDGHQDGHDQLHGQSQPHDQSHYLQLSLTQLWDLHFRDGKSITQIACDVGCNRKTIAHRFRLLSASLRPQNSVRECVDCGAPVEKRLHARRDKTGAKILFGTRCQLHRRQYDAARERKRRCDKDPMVGKRRKGAWRENRVAKAVAKAMTIWILWHWPFLIEPWWTQRQLAPCDHHWVILEVMPPTDTLTVEALQDAIDALNQYTHPSWEPISDLRLWPRPRSTKVTNRYCSKCGEKAMVQLN